MTASTTIGVLLAGGASSRMGRPKPLLRDESGRTFLAKLVRTLEQGGCDAVIVVGGKHVSEIAQELPAGALLVFNRGWKAGQLSSAKAGLEAALKLGAARVILHPIDIPLVTRGDVARILTALSEFDLAVASHRGNTGHPVALNAATAIQVVRERASSLRVALSRSAPRRVEVPCSSGCLRGANTPKELKLLFGSSTKHRSHAARMR
jgi:CTP:molybdopterin cytidylyltransferase MocA